MSHIVFCSIYGCYNASSDKNRRFFHFPARHSREKYQKWLNATGRKELVTKNPNYISKYCFVCDVHFTPAQLALKKLPSNAVPKLKLPQEVHDVLPDFVDVKVYETRYTRGNLLKRKNNNAEELNSTSKYTKRKKLKNEADLISLFKNITKLQEIIKKFKESEFQDPGDRQFKIFALNLYFTSPSAYRIMRETLYLPSSDALREINLNVSSNITPDVLQLLKLRCQKLKETERYCVMCAVEMPMEMNLNYSISEDKIIGFQEVNGKQTLQPASRAIVFMTRGLFSEWEQIVNYCFLEHDTKCDTSIKELQDWIDEMINKLQEIGLNVISFTSNQGPIFLNFVKDRKISCDKPYFSVNNKKIYYIFDVHDFSKCIRNDLYSNDYEYNYDKLHFKHKNDNDIQHISWKYIEDFYQYDFGLTSDEKYAPNLTYDHIYIKTAKDITYATEIFSEGVVAGIFDMIFFEAQHRRARGTVKFIEVMSNLIKMLNSLPEDVTDNEKDDNSNEDNCFKQAFANKKHQIELIETASHIFSNIRESNLESNSNTKFVTGPKELFTCFKITLKSITSLTQDLISLGFDSIFTGRLNMETLYKFLASEEQHKEKMTALQLTKEFKNYCLLNVLDQADNNKHMNDLDESLMYAEQLLYLLHQKSSSSTSGVNSKNIDIPNEVGEIAFRHFDSYLLEQCYNVHKCEKMREYIKQSIDITDADTDYILKHIESNSSEKRCLTLITNPPKPFKDFIEIMVDKFTCIFNQTILSNIEKEMYKALKDVIFREIPCPCFPLEYLIKMFVRLRILHLVKINNTLLADKSVVNKCFNVSPPSQETHSNKPPCNDGALRDHSYPIPASTFYDHNYPTPYI